MTQLCPCLPKDAIEESLQTIYDIATDNLGSLCLSNGFRSLTIPLSADRYEAARQKADLAAMVLQDVGVNRHGGKQSAIRFSVVNVGEWRSFYCPEMEAQIK